MIEISGFSKTYKGNSVKAVDNIDLIVKNGEIFGFLGPNGAGKSTTIKCITGILPFSEGHIKICGYDIIDDPMLAKQKIGYVPDEHIIYEGLSGLEYINFISDIFGITVADRKERTEKYASLFGLQDKLNDKISSYSHGMKQKISVISALVHDPEVWILDEPLMGLDPQSAYNLKQIMQERAKEGKTVFFSSHVMEVVEKLCDRVAIIDKGKLLMVCDMAELKERRSDLSLEELFLSLTAGSGNDNH